MNERTRVHIVELLLLSVAAIWGTNFSLIKLLYEYFHPLAFNALRMTLATLTMVAILKARGVPLAIDRRDLPSLAGLGILSNTGYQLLFVLGLERTRAGNAGLLLSLVPIFAYIAGLALGRERFNRTVLAGILMSVLGVAAITVFGSADLSFAGTLVGDLMIIAAAFCWGWYTGSSSTMLARYGPLRVTVVAMLFGVGLMLPITLPWLIVHPWSAVVPWAWAGLAASAWLAIVYSYFDWAHAIRTIGVARTVVVGNLTPIVALLAGWLLLGERPVIAQGAAIVLILAGIFLVRSQETTPIIVREESG